jgi:hypothetical protein
MSVPRHDPHRLLIRDHDDSLTRPHELLEQLSAAPTVPAAELLQEFAQAVVTHQVALRDRWTRAQVVSCIKLLVSHGGPVRPVLLEWIQASPPVALELLQAINTSTSASATWPTLPLLIESLPAAAAEIRFSATRKLATELTSLTVKFIRHHATAQRIFGLDTVGRLCPRVPGDCQELCFEVLCHSLSFNDEHLLPALFPALQSVLPVIDPHATGAATKQLLKALLQGLTRTQSITLRRHYLQGTAQLIEAHLRLGALRLFKPLLLATLHYLVWSDAGLLMDACRLLLVLARHCWVRLPAHGSGLLVALGSLAEPQIAPPQPWPTELSVVLSQLTTTLQAALGDAHFTAILTALPLPQQQFLRSLLLETVSAPSGDQTAAAAPLPVSSDDVDPSRSFSG